MRVLLLVALLLFILTGGLYLAGEQLRPTPTGGDFSLQGGCGPVALQDYRGRWVVLYFGFASCPDVCPTSLARWAHAINGLSPQEQQQLVLLFITLDPQRDTPALITEYARHFHPDFVGLSGSHEQIDAVAKRYGVIYRRVELESAITYTIDHSSYSYLLNPQGELVRMLTDGSDAATRRQALRDAIQSGR